MAKGKNQGRRQEVFQGRAPRHFLISKAGAETQFLFASMVKMKEFSGQGAWSPLPMPAYALGNNLCCAFVAVLYQF